MKDKLVLWGSNAEDQKILVALELIVEANRVRLYIFPEEIATEEFSQGMLTQWRNGQDFDIPDGYERTEKELSLTDPMVPEDIKVEREDLLQRAQTEWQFIVLSSKMHQAYRSELEDLKERIAKLEKFDSGIWEELKGFWNKVQEQVRERNLFRDHANSLRDQTNELFASLKALRSKMDAAFNQKSKESKDKFMDALAKVEERLAADERFQSLFDELKALQREFNNSQMTKNHRSKVWQRLDGAFKAVKAKRFGAGEKDGRSALDRIKRRYDGLIAAIGKMENSIKRDEKSLSYENRKAEGTHEQLEAQLRKAKVAMIEERIRSKKDKHADMLKTKAELERRMDREAQKEKKREEARKREEYKKAAEDKIKKEIKAAAVERKDEEGNKTQGAKASQATDEPGSMQDTMRTITAISEAVSQRIQEAVDDLKAEKA